MSPALNQEKHLVQRLQRALPLRARGRPALLAFFRARGIIGNVAPRLKVIGIFAGGPQSEFLCRFTIEDCARDETFIAPLDQLALDRRQPVAREADAHRRQSPRAGAA